MNTTKVSAHRGSNPVRQECSVDAISHRLFERTLSLSEVVELSEKCGFWDIEGDTKKTFSRPLTFNILATQAFASVSRMVE